MDDLWLRRVLVGASAIVYWGGVYVQARRVRRRIGRSPNVRPRGARERLLWVGWGTVIVGWFAQPFVVGLSSPWAPLRVHSGLLHPVGLIGGALALALGYAGTLWCYAAMGSAWRMGINRNEKPPLVRAGPYARVRHPIYLFQVMMLVGACLLLPSMLALFLVLVHLVCVVVKAADEEAFLLGVHGTAYQEYQGMSGKVWPRWR